MDPKETAPTDPDSGAVEAYERYLFVSGGKSLASGAELPIWEDLDEKYKAAWRAAADPTAPRFHRGCCGQ